MVGLVVDVIVHGCEGSGRPAIWMAPRSAVSIGKQPRDISIGDTYAGISTTFESPGGNR
jgi:hypothetical protein